MNDIETTSELRAYTYVYVTLLILTGVTVAVSVWPLARYAAVALALGIASLKAGLIAWHFMHMKSERPLVWTVMLIGVAALVILVVGIFPDMAWKLR